MEQIFFRTRILRTLCCNIKNDSISEVKTFCLISVAPAGRLAMTRRVHPLVSLNPYQGNWTIKVRVTSKGNMRTFKNFRGEGCVFNVELTDEDVSLKSSVLRI